MHNKGTYPLETLQADRERLSCRLLRERLDFLLLLWRYHHQSREEVVLAHRVLACGTAIASQRRVQNKGRTRDGLDQVLIILVLLLSLPAILVITIASWTWCRGCR